MLKTRYESFDHTADLGLRIYGKDLKELFENAAFALFDQITATDSVGASKSEVFEVTGDDPADLLVEWLRELLFFWLGHDKLAPKTVIKEISNNRVKAKVYYEEYLPKKHPIKTEIKAVTYHMNKVTEIDGGYEATVIFDK